MTMKLYNFFRSGTSHRVRIALNPKGLEHDYVAVDLRCDEQAGAVSKALNPQGLLPALQPDALQAPA
jgi:maleylpyruvate isomerase